MNDCPRQNPAYRLTQIILKTSSSSRHPRFLACASPEVAEWKIVVESVVLWKIVVYLILPHKDSMAALFNSIGRKALWVFSRGE